MRKALDTRDLKALERSAHTLRGASSNLGAVAVAEAALDLERLARSEELESANGQLEILQKEIERLFTELEVLRAH
jgi:hypothetical protein